MSVSIAVVYHSGYGHTAVQANAVADGIASINGVRAHLAAVDKLTEQDWAEMDSAKGIIFGSPTYMGSASAQFKAFADESSKRWYARSWSGKLAAGFTNSASWSGDKLATLQQLAIFAAQHGMIWVSLGLLPGNNSSTGSANDLNRVGSFLGAMAQSASDLGPDQAPSESDKKTAHHLGARVAKAALNWKEV